MLCIPSLVGCRRLAWAPLGQTLVSTSYMQNHLWLWDLSKPRPALKHIAGHGETNPDCTCHQARNDERVSNGVVMHNCPARFMPDHDGGIELISFLPAHASLPNNLYACTISRYAEQTHVWNLLQPEIGSLCPLDVFVTSLVFSPDVQKMGAVYAQTKKVMVSRFTTYTTPKWNFVNNIHSPRTLKWLKDNTTLVVDTAEMIYLINVPDDKPVSMRTICIGVPTVYFGDSPCCPALPANLDSVLFCETTYLPKLAIVRVEQFVRIYEVCSKTLVAVTCGDEDPYQPEYPQKYADMKKIGEINLSLDLQNSKHRLRIFSTSWSPNGDRAAIIALAEYESRAFIKVWDYASNRCMTRYFNFTPSKVEACIRHKWSPDGNMLAVAGNRCIYVMQVGWEESQPSPNASRGA